MRQLTCTAPGAVEWLDVPEPSIVDPTDALVRPVAVARCEIDPFLVLAGPRGEDGFALGHEAVVEVMAAGPQVGGLGVGELALPSFQISCGACPTCRRGHTANCERYPVLSDFGMQPLSGVEYGGMLSDLVRVPHAHAMLTPLPAGLDPVAVASVPDNVVDGYRAVAPHLRQRPGADVLVACHGTPGIGLYAAQSALALGAGTVTVAGADDEILALAERIGATPMPTDFADRTAKWPIVVDCGHRVEGLHWAIRATEPEGTLHSVSYYAAEPMVPLPLGRLYTLGINFRIGRAHSATLIAEVIDLVAAGRLHPEQVTTSVIDWEEAPDRYTDDTVKLIVSRASAPSVADPGDKP
ncbi:MAG: zinc-dependent alcohol dehydrogenase [Acidimicrobiales bacterium]